MSIRSLATGRGRISDWVESGFHPLHDFPIGSLQTEDVVTLFKIARCFFQQHMAAVAICLANQLRPAGITDMVQAAQHAPASQIKHDVDWHELTVNGFDKCRHVGLGQIRTPDKGLAVKAVELSAEIAGIRIVIVLINILQARSHALFTASVRLVSDRSAKAFEANVKPPIRSIPRWVPIAVSGNRGNDKGRRSIRCGG